MWYLTQHYAEFEVCTLVDLKGAYTVGARRVSVQNTSTSLLSKGGGATWFNNKFGGSSREVAISVTIGLSTLTSFNTHRALTSIKQLHC